MVKYFWKWMGTFEFVGVFDWDRSDVNKNGTLPSEG